ncbi:MAG: L-threonylcarbamoyladenylate synthase [Planctomycetota bacterium]
MVSEAAIEAAGRLIREGGLVAMPTETVYGLGANALDAEAVARVFAAKARPSFDPLIVHVADMESAWALADLDAVPAASRPLVRVLADVFWPGPLTMVLPKRGVIPGVVTSGLKTVGLRVPAHPVALALIEAADRPIAAPSANVFGGISPTRAEHVTVPCDAVLDGGPCSTGMESTVVGFDPGASESGVVVLRLGGTSTEAIEQVVGGAVAVAKPGEKIASPGMLERHYAPRTPLRIVERSNYQAIDIKGQKIGRLSLRGEAIDGALEFTAHEVLDPQGDLTAAAARLFEAMHRLDDTGLDLIVAELVADVGLGRAINDRLRRAAVQGK